MTSFRRVRASAIVAVALLLGACSTAGSAVKLLSSPEPHAAPTGSLASPRPLPSTYIAGDPIVSVIHDVAPAVVNVTSSTVDPNALFGGSLGKAVGTGFVIRSDGVIATNFHVVEGALKIKVTLPPPDGRSFTGRVIGGDSDHDLAVVKIDATGLPTVPLGSSSDLQLGERVIALGYALALPGGPTVTSGIISGLERTVDVEDPEGNGGAGLTRTIEDALQTDAAINPGNSGGPLVDLAGNVVGINTAGAGQAENVGFAIAIDAARPIIDRAMTHPGTQLAYLGVSTVSVDPGLAAQFDLPAKQGAWVRALAPGGPAAEAGIRENDIIVAFEGTTVESSDALGKAILDHSPGDDVDVEVVHEDGSRETFHVTLGVRPLPGT